MHPLSTTLRNQLERTVIAARDAAEIGAAAALQRLAVDKPEPFTHMIPEHRELRKKLRAKGRQLGDERKPNGEQDIWHLHRECAYEVWHQMLFARFLAENHLLMHPDGVPVTLDECEELAKDDGTDGWTLAGRYASKMLPQVFRADDPVLKVTFAPEDKQALEALLAALPCEVFTASDALGWCYQFWQSEEKRRVNAAGNKIGADELPSVTQLFTEDYMVDFLLDNTLGAWWAGRKAEGEKGRGGEGETRRGGDAEKGRRGEGERDLFADCETEADCRRLVALPGVDWEYLRFVRDEAEDANSESEISDFKSQISNLKSQISNPKSEISNLKSEISNPKSSWRPAAGTFDGWPKTAKELKCLDPCMGSGHFVVAMFERLVALRMAEETLDEAAAVAAVIRDNLFGLEIDPRCTQIAAFNLALAAWRRVGHRPLPAMNLACSGLAPNTREADWLALAGDNEKLRNGMERLYQLFQKAAVLGSLINPRAAESDLLVAGFHELQPLLEKALAQEAEDDAAHEMAVTARGLAKAAEILAGQFTLVATNVPYLGRGKQDEVFTGYCDRVHRDARADLAACFIERCFSFCAAGGSSALVTPQSWLFQSSYRRLREKLLKTALWDFVARLGAGAFETISGEVVNVALICKSRRSAGPGHQIAGYEVEKYNLPAEKARGLVADAAIRVSQQTQFENPHAKVVLSSGGVGTPLGLLAETFKGICSGDGDHFQRYFWEIETVAGRPAWAFQQGAIDTTTDFHGRDGIFLWEKGEEGGEFYSSVVQRLGESGTSAWIRGRGAWGRDGVVVRIMKHLPVTRYTGQIYDNNVAVIVPKNREDLPAVWAFCSSDSFNVEVRKLNQKLSVTDESFVQVPFDLEHWQKIAAEKYPHGLPKPFSSDPTQWLFSGHPAGSDQPLHVAVARLLGYQWPRQTGSSFPDCPALGPDGLEELADADGIVCIPAVGGEQPGADRLLTLLAACGIQPDRNLDEWFRDKFFEEHFKLFHHRPFVWHIWDGRKKDGFHALVNYHKLDRRLLEKLIYTYLGDWINRQKAAEQRNESGAETRRFAAEDLQNRLKLILAGEPPYDIFVRWKPIEQQAIGWDPDLNDGVRMNIRPFVRAGVLRKNPNIKWTKDRGKEPERPNAQYPWFWDGKDFTGDRVNDVHLTLTEKRAAREARPRTKQ